jgi:Glycosyltransferase family 87
MSAPSALVQGPARRAGPIRRAIRRESSRLRDRRRLLAMALLVVVFAFAIAGMLARGDTAGADAQAYWAAVRLWLDGGDPYHPTGPFLPYVYAPWMLPLFIPWAMLPWEVAWFAWRGVSLLLLLWTIRWAYARRPLATAILVVILAIPAGANIDTGNVNLLLAVALFGGLLWGLATWMKWVPAPLWLVLPARARGWGLAFLLLAALLSLVMLPLTIIQLQALFGFSHRPIRADYLVFVWSAVPWWWRRRDPFAVLRPSAWATACARQWRRAAAWSRAFVRAPGATARLARGRMVEEATAFLGLDGSAAPGGQGAAALSPDDAVRRQASEIGD